MANITITIPDATLPTIVNAYCLHYGYQDLIPDPADETGETLIPNPESKAAFTKKMVIRQIKETVIIHEKQKILNTLRAQADIKNNELESSINLT